MNSWTARLFRQTRSHLTLSSFWRYRNFLLHEPYGPSDGLLELHIKPSRRPVYLRKWGSDPATFEEVYVEEVYRPVVEHLRSCQTLVDLGANIGLASIYLSSHLGCRCFCVEANPDTFAILQKNLAGTGAQLLNSAVWDSKIMLAVNCPAERYSMSTVQPDPNGNIPGIPMADLIDRSGFSTIDLLKIDIEGAEAALFRGELSWLTPVRAIAIEFHDESRKETRFDEVMLERGFQIVDSGHTTIALRT
jgi:FkbM family methyltransferase